MRANRRGTPLWLHDKERGQALLVRGMAWLSLSLGRPLTRPMVYLIAGYFLITSVKARRASQSYLRRILPGTNLIDRYRHFMTFATTIHDRLYLLNDQFDRFDLTWHGADLFQHRGGLLFGAHFGSFELLRAVARSPQAPPVSVAMYPDNAARLNRILQAINPAVMLDIIELGHLDAMLEIRRRVEEGHLVGILADRASAADHYLPISFLGSPAPFPSGPFRLATLLRCPVYFMSGVHQGGNRYAIHFSLLNDFQTSQPGTRDADMCQLVTQYALELERQCRLFPYNWFNFYDFWKAPDSL